MKRLLCVTLIVIVVFHLYSCGNTDIRTPVNFYYNTDPVDYNNPQGVISPEIRDRDGFSNDLTGLLNLYMQGPVTEGYLSPFPQGVNVDSISISDNVTDVYFSKELSTLTGYRLTIACVCISMTVLDLTNSQSVRIHATDALLDGSAYIEMTHQDLIFLDDYTEKAES